MVFYDEGCRVFPKKDGHYQLPAPLRVFHKSRIPKVMVLTVCARPRLVYGFDGKVGLWSFTLERPAMRNNIRPGTVANDAIILEDVRVDAVQYCTKVVAKGGVFEKLREVMWWSHTAATYKTVAGVRVPCGKIVSGSGDSVTTRVPSVQKPARDWCTSTMGLAHTQHVSILKFLLRMAR